MIKVGQMPQEKTDQFTESELLLFRDRLDEYRQTLDRAAARVRENKTKDLWIFRRASLERALERLAAFDLEVRKSIEADILGKPYDAKTTKTRGGTKKKPAKKAVRDKRKIPRNPRSS